MIQRYHIQGDYTYSEKCDCSFCEGHETDGDVDRVFDLDLPLDPSENDILRAVAAILAREGEDDVDFDYGVLIEELDPLPIDVVLRQLGVPMLPGFAEVAA